MTRRGIRRKHDWRKKWKAMIHNLYTKQQMPSAEYEGSSIQKK